MKAAAAILVAATALGGCLSPSAYRQSNALVGRPLSEAVALYGQPDQPVSPGEHAYSWSRGRLAGVCKLNVRTDAEGAITKASVVAVGLRTCKSILEAGRNG